MFSVVIPTYNRADKLKRALASLKIQSWQEFEVLVCDDGSNDDTKSVAMSFEKDLDIKYIYLENSGGPARPRNFGIKKAKYDWICFLDSDDWWYQNKLTEVAQKIQAFSSDIYYHDLDVYSVNENIPCSKLHSRDLGETPYIELLAYGNGILNSSAVVRKKSLIGVGDIDENKDLVSMEDYDLWIRLAQAQAKFTYMPKSLGGYWINDGDHVSANSLRGLKCRDIIYKKNINVLSPTDKSLFQQSFDLHLAAVSVDNKKIVKATFMILSILTKPRSLRLFTKALKFFKVILKEYVKLNLNKIVSYEY
ncbi:glycosyl transferase [Rivularia sp. IAM M-261]|nr:glycosyl transferase [Rivularia sp. IAM M-261]